MPLQVQFDLKQRERNIQKILNSFKAKAERTPRDIGELFDNFHESLSNMDEDTQKAYLELKKHHYLSNFKDAMEDLDEFENMDLMILGDVKECEKDVKASIIGAYRGE